jgi:hypothetical protein
MRKIILVKSNRMLTFYKLMFWITSILAAIGIGYQIGIH